MINNRQQNGRRRGRGGPQMRNGAPGGVDRGNRIDNRARGNAAQLHEKYRNLARDAQTQGDRVMTEYYLQFADHYFRVLSESRARFEEQQPRRQQGDDYEDGGDEGDGFDINDRVGNDRMQNDRMASDRGGQAPQREPRPDYRQDNRYAERGDNRRVDMREPNARQQPRREFAPSREIGEEAAAMQRRPEDDRRAEEAANGVRQAEPARDGEAPADPAPRRARGRPPRSAADDAEAGPDRRIEADRLPPALSGTETSADAVPSPEALGGEPDAPKRRRTRRVAKDDGDSIAVA